MLRLYVDNSKSRKNFICLIKFPVLSYTLDLGGLNRRHELGRGLLAVTLRVVADPAPQVLAGLFHGHLRLPLELGVGERGVGRQVKDIALATGDNFVGHLAADNLAKGLDHLKDGATAAGAQVPGLDAGLVLAEILEGSEMALGEVDNVDVVANGSSVVGRVV